MALHLVPGGLVLRFLAEDFRECFDHRVHPVPIEGEALDRVGLGFPPLPAFESRARTPGNRTKFIPVGLERLVNGPRCFMGGNRLPPRPSLRGETNQRVVSRVMPVYCHCPNDTRVGLWRPPPHPRSLHPPAAKLSRSGTAGCRCPTVPSFHSSKATGPAPTSGEPPGSCSTRRFKKHIQGNARSPGSKYLPAKRRRTSWRAG